MIKNYINRQLIFKIKYIILIKYPEISQIQVRILTTIVMIIIIKNY